MLIILDGWGHGPDDTRSAIAQAKTPFVDSMYQKYAHSELITFGEEVGLPEGQMGNSEVGHLNIGAGRIVYQELARINKAIRSGELANNQILNNALAELRNQGGALHLLGLVSDGGVHSHINHLLAISDIANQAQIEQIFVHAFMDGRDCSPTSGLGFIQEVEDHISGSNTQIATVIGRYYAMDRDKRWERIKLAYDMMVHGKGREITSAADAVFNSYEKGVTDEFIDPVVVVDETNQAIGKIKDGDLVICFNFRTDRPRQIIEALTQSSHPEHNLYPLNIRCVTMTEYDKTFKNIEVIFPSEDITNTLGEYISNLGYTQLRMAETEKYPHVTYFFSGGRENPFLREKRLVIPSPKVATYDLQPEMSAPEVTEVAMREINQNAPDFICLNFANTDMVGHTGVFAAAMKAAETVDKGMSKLVPLAIEKGYRLVIIADHGNADYMINDDGSPHTAHTTNPVPCIIIDPGAKYQVFAGKLADIAPTILKLMELTPPDEMNGNVLIQYT